MKAGIGSFVPVRTYVVVMVLLRTVAVIKRPQNAAIPAVKRRLVVSCDGVLLGKEANVLQQYKTLHVLA